MYRFPDKARVCFVGDSLTHNNRYVCHIVSYYREHFPDSGVEFYNCGTSGGHLGTMLTIWEQDVMRYEPTHIVLMTAVNDAKTSSFKRFSGIERYNALYAAYEEYQERLKLFCQKVKDIGAELILCVPLPFAEYQCAPDRVLPGGSALILGYADFIRQFAKENGYPLCDYHSYLSRVMQEEDIYAEDGVHLKNRGQYHLAKCFLAFQGLDLGEEKELPEDIVLWDEKVHSVRDNFAAVHLVLGDSWFSKSAEEQMQAFETFMARDHEKLGTLEFQIRYATAYLNGKKDEEKNIACLKAFMKQGESKNA